MLQAQLSVTKKLYSAGDQGALENVAHKPKVNIKFEYFVPYQRYQHALIMIVSYRAGYTGFTHQRWICKQKQQHACARLFYKVKFSDRSEFDI